MVTICDKKNDNVLLLKGICKEAFTLMGCIGSFNFIHLKALVTTLVCSEMPLKSRG